MFTILRMYMHEGVQVGDCLDNRGPQVVITTDQHGSASAASQMQKIGSQKNIHQFLLVP